MLMTVNQIRSTIRKIIIREDTSHEDKLASMIGTLDVENVVQALLLGETIGLIEEYSEQKAEFLSGDVITWNVNLKRSFAEKIEAAIFPKVYASIPRVAMEIDAFVRVQGKIDDRDGVLNCIVNEMKVGDLKMVQSQQHLFVDPEEKKSSEEAVDLPQVYNIVIPDSATKAQIADLKALLRQHETTDKDALKVTVNVGGKTIPLPISVLLTPALKTAVTQILQ